MMDDNTVLDVFFLIEYVVVFVASFSVAGWFGKAIYRDRIQSSFRPLIFGFWLVAATQAVDMAVKIYFRLFHIFIDGETQIMQQPLVMVASGGLALAWIVLSYTMYRYYSQENRATIDEGSDHEAEEGRRFGFLP